VTNCRGNRWPPPSAGGSGMASEANPATRADGDEVNPRRPILLPSDEVRLLPAPCAVAMGFFAVLHVRSPRGPSGTQYPSLLFLHR
jgi:hypothetical protein